MLGILRGSNDGGLVGGSSSLSPSSLIPGVAPFPAQVLLAVAFLLPVVGAVAVVRQWRRRSATRRVITAMYVQYNPDKLADVEALLDAHAGAEAVLVEKVRQRYLKGGGIGMKGKVGKID